MTLLERLGSIEAEDRAEEARQEKEMPFCEEGCGSRSQLIFFVGDQIAYRCIPCDHRITLS